MTRLLISSAFAVTDFVFAVHWHSWLLFGLGLWMMALAIIRAIYVGRVTP